MSNTRKPSSPDVKNGEPRMVKKRTQTSLNDKLRAARGKLFRKKSREGTPTISPRGSSGPVSPSGNGRGSRSAAESAKKSGSKRGASSSDVSEESASSGSAVSFAIAPKEDAEARSEEGNSASKEENAEEQEHAAASTSDDDGEGTVGSDAGAVDADGNGREERAADGERSNASKEPASKPMLVSSPSSGRRSGPLQAVPSSPPSRHKPLPKRTSGAKAKGKGKGKGGGPRKKGAKGTVPPRSGSDIIRRNQGGVLDAQAARSPILTPSSKDKDNYKGTLKRGLKFRYRFSEPDSESNLILLPAGPDGTQRIKGGTLVKLVERLTYPKYPNPATLRIFLMTYRSFTTPMEFLDLLINRFMIPPPPNASKEQRSYFSKTHQKPVRLRVFNVLRTWLSDFAYDFVGDSELCKALRTFCDVHMKCVMEKAAEQILSLLESVQSRQTALNDSTPISSKDMPRPHLPTCRPSELSVLNLHPQEVARQLTLVESELFRAIKPWELLELAWSSKKDNKQRAPNVLAMIHRSNMLTPWITGQVVSAKSMKTRIEVLTRCIQTMSYLEELHNFNAVMEYLGALQNAAVSRLKETWAGLPKKWRRKWEELTARMDRNGNFRVYRQILETVPPPSIPYLGMFLTDLTFIEEGNPDYLDDDKQVVNMAKRSLCAAKIAELQRYQDTLYVLQPIPMIREFLTDAVPMDNEALFDLSLAIKARGPTAKELDDRSAAMPETITRTPSSSMLARKPEDWGEMDYPEDYPFKEADSDDNIVIDDENPKLILFATLPKLIQRLTYEMYSDQAFVRSFLLMHKSIVDSKTMLQLLITRYNMAHPVTEDAAVRSRYEAKVVRPVRLRVFNALKQWVDKYPQDFRDEALAQHLIDFAENVMKKTGMEKPAERLVEGARLAMEGRVRSVVLKKHSRAPPAPILPKNGAINWGEVRLVELSTEEIARQLTLMQFALYTKISDRELLAYIDDVDSEVDIHEVRQKECPNVMALQEQNDWLRRLIASLVVTVRIRESGRAIEWAINLALALRAHNNFNSCVAVVEGLLTPAVANMEGAWAHLSSKAAKAFDDLKRFSEDVKTYYRNLQWMSTVSAPAFPSLPSYLEELQRLEVALDNRMPASLHERELINMEKRLKMAQTVTNLLQFQSSGYVLKEVVQVVDVLNCYSVLSDQEIVERGFALANEEESTMLSSGDDDEWDGEEEQAGSPPKYGAGYATSGSNSSSGSASGAGSGSGSRNKNVLTRALTSHFKRSSTGRRPTVGFGKGGRSKASSHIGFHGKRRDSREEMEFSSDSDTPPDRAAFSQSMSGMGSAGGGGAGWIRRGPESGSSNNIRGSGRRVKASPRPRKSQSDSTALVSALREELAKDEDSFLKRWLSGVVDELVQSSTKELRQEVAALRAEIQELKGGADTAIASKEDQQEPHDSAAASPPATEDEDSALDVAEAKVSGNDNGDEEEEADGNNGEEENAE